MIADKEFLEKRRVLIQEIAESTGITRNTLSKMINQYGVGVQSETIDKLCEYFSCRIEELVEYVSDDDQ